MNFYKTFFRLLSIIFTLNLCACLPSIGQNENELSAKKFAALLSQTPDAQIVDARTPEEFAQKRLSKAVNINYQGTDFEVKLEKLDKQKPVFIYCLAGVRSAKAATVMRTKGFKQVYEMQGGLAKWIAGDLPLETKENAANKTGISLTDFEAKLAKEKLTLVDFSASWCQPCKMLKPILEKVNTDHTDKVEVQVYDYDQNPSIAQHFKIDALPTLSLFKKGKMVWQNVGLMSEEKIVAILNEYK